MTIEDAKNILKLGRPQDDCSEYQLLKFDEALKVAVDYLTPKSGGWISVKDKLPTKTSEARVLVQVQALSGDLWPVCIGGYRYNRKDWIIWFDGKISWINDYKDTLKVIAWQPLPDLYYETPPKRYFYDVELGQEYEF